MLLSTTLEYSKILRNNDKNENYFIFISLNIIYFYFYRKDNNHNLSKYFYQIYKFIKFRL